MGDCRLNTTLAILVGGEGARMGQPKELLTVGEQPILSHIFESAHWPGPTAVVTSPQRRSPPGVRPFDAEWTDPVAGLGPMRGALTALEQATTDQVIISPVDMPLMTGEIFAWLADQLHQRPAAAGILIERATRDQRRIEPLPAIFRTSAAPLLRQQLDKGNRSLHGLARLGAVIVVPAPYSWPAEVWTNLNSPQDLAQFHQRR